MLTVFIATFVIFALVIFGMSLGYLVKRKSIQGSCGGISSLGLEKVCDCPEPCDARKKRLAREAQRNGLADAPAGAGNDAYLALQSTLHDRLLNVRSRKNIRPPDADALRIMLCPCFVCPLFSACRP